jgi:hypothetical protein
MVPTIDRELIRTGILNSQHDYQRSKVGETQPALSRVYSATEHFTRTPGLVEGTAM